MDVLDLQDVAVSMPHYRARHDQKAEDLTVRELQDKGGNTPLHRACHDGKVEDLKLLLAAGADASVKDNVRAFNFSCVERSGRVMEGHSEAEVLRKRCLRVRMQCESI